MPKMTKPKKTSVARKPGRQWVRDSAGVAEPTTWAQVLNKRRAEIATLELEARRAELVERAAVDRANRATARMIQTDVQGLGRRLAPLLVGRDMIAIQVAIDRAARGMLTQWKKFPDGAITSKG